MKYKEIEIGIPTLEQVEECCEDKKLHVPAIEVFNYYQKTGWTTRKHRPVKTLEAACAAVNGAFLKRLHKDEDFVPTYDHMSDSISKSDYHKAKCWLDKNFSNFCECMNIIKEHNPEKWAELYKLCVDYGVGYSPSND